MSVVSFALDGFEMKPFTSSAGRTRYIYRMGSGPAVIIIHEVPGITPLVAAFARRVAGRGMTAVLPNLFGTAGRPMTIPYALTSFAHVCVGKEFTLLALNKTSAIVDYLRELAAHELQTCGGPGVGALDLECVSRSNLKVPVKGALR
jgi:dienelactone hydrolase